MKDVQVGCVRFATIVVVGLLANGMSGYVRPAAAETVRDACTHDAFRLCSNTIPDVGRTKACLARHRNSLSPKCQTAFSGSTHERSADRSTHERSADRSAHERSADRSENERSADRSENERSADRSENERSADRSENERSADRSENERIPENARHHSTHPRHYGYYRHYHHYRGFHIFPFF
jgi:hypothetical protein